MIVAAYTTVPARLSTPNWSAGTSTKPATSEVNARITGSARPMATAYSPRPVKKRSARSTSALVMSTYLPTRSTAVRPPSRPAP